MTLPTPQVLLDNETGAFPFDITSKVLSTDGYQFTRGRDDWIGAVTTGELRLTLNNSDGRFTPGSTILATPSPITVDQRIRLKETINGTTYTRFTGYVKSWPVAWPGVVPTFSTVDITATDAQARVERRPLKSMFEEERLLGDPSSYYTLSEPDGSTTVGDTSGGKLPTLGIVGTGTPPAFGTGIGPVDGLSAIVFSGGQYLSGSGGTWLPTASQFTLCATVNTTMSPSSSAAIAFLDEKSTVTDINNIGRVGLTLDSTGMLVVVYSDASFFAITSAAGPVINDGHTHDVAATWDGANLKAWVDGVNVATVAQGTGAAVPMARLSIGGTPTAASGSLLTGTVSHVAVYPAALAGATLLSQATVALTGAAGESGTARLTRLAGYAGLTLGTLDSSLTNVSAAATSGQSAFEAIQDVTAAEFGLTFFDGSGNLTFHNRNRVPLKTSPDLTLSSQWVTPDVAPTVDDQQIVNYVEATAVGTGATTVANSAASESSHGRYPDSPSYLVQTDDEALYRASWIVGKFAEPGEPRFGTLTINLYGMTASQASTVLAALDLDCWLRVTSAPSQTPGGTTIDVVVQGWTATATGESWEIACNVVPQSLYSQIGIFGVSKFGDGSVFYI